ncbi:uncharacterized protein BXZ73DRAFT_75687 [Epithele typhae]|uniref:uncharacterized protein n=1 Tax=Epithele typhae TaxID=378194 RepID=UPI002007FB79|nr:uncharacterized protein BXZ73DRAFT_75687 [Epithele typhae]KAH9940065.1 hypothetical protein BXZ73DRAFT_75687 [Epithele typhae]
MSLVSVGGLGRNIGNALDTGDNARVKVAPQSVMTTYACRLCLMPGCAGEKELEEAYASIKTQEWPPPAVRVREWGERSDALQTVVRLVFEFWRAVGEAIALREPLVVSVGAQEAFDSARMKDVWEGRRKELYAIMVYHCPRLSPNVLSALEVEEMENGQWYVAAVVTSMRGADKFYVRCKIVKLFLTPLLHLAPLEPPLLKPMIMVVLAPQSAYVLYRTLGQALRARLHAPVFWQNTVLLFERGGSKALLVEPYFATPIAEHASSIPHVSSLALAELDTLAAARPLDECVLGAVHVHDIATLGWWTPVVGRPMHVL